MLALLRTNCNKQRSNCVRLHKRVYKGFVVGLQQQQARAHSDTTHQRTDVSYYNAKFFSAPPHADKVKLVYTPKEGRSLYSTRLIRSGEVVLQDTPYAYSLLEQEQGHFCDYCLGPIKQKTHSCKGCKEAHYCSTECASKAHKSHSIECQTLRKLHIAKANILKGLITDDDLREELIEKIRLIARVLLRRKIEMDSASSHATELLTDNIHTFKDVQLLLSNREEFEQKHKERLRYAVNLLSAIVTDPELLVGDISRDDLLELFCQSDTNDFTFMNGNDVPIGLGVYTLASLLNQSCTPNLEIQNRLCTGRVPTLTFVAVHDIAPETPLCHAYIDLTLPQHERKAVISEIYNFTCDCNDANNNNNNCNKHFLDKYLCKECSSGLTLCQEVGSVVRLCSVCGTKAG